LTNTNNLVGNVVAATSRKALQRAIEAAGGQAALAAAIGVRQSHISFWLHKSKTGIPAERVGDIEKVTGVARYELRPDLFAPPPNQTGPAFAEEGTPLDASVPTSRPRGDHFSRFKHLRRANFRSQDEIADHVRALREEWDRR
jgi:DNA-binding transcriptional regulator YdaS (Cro superfamily)